MKVRLAAGRAAEPAENVDQVPGVSLADHLEKENTRFFGTSFNAI